MNENNQKIPALLIEKTSSLSIHEVLQMLAREFTNAVTFSTSFSNEDQVIAHQIATSGADISLFTLDTGRLFQATYDVWHNTITALGVEIKAYYPDPDVLQSFIQENGPNSFYRSQELRKQCCLIRKVLQLKRALANQKIWITGLRADHSANRSEIPQFEWDKQNKVIKYHPLLHWTTEQVTAYIKTHNIPYNTLTEQGFVSIGCEPCTRAIKPGEDFRAGRWWWEDGDKKECGLHVQSNAAKQKN